MPSLMVTVFGALAVAVNFVIQAAIASKFGVGFEMDAFLAANTIPQYISTVVIGSMGFVFLPLFIDYSLKNKKEELWILTSSVINIFLLLLLVILIFCYFFSNGLLKIVVPGIDQKTLKSAQFLSLIIWPSILFSGAISLLTNIYNSFQRFIWPSFISLLGSAIYLAFLLILVMFYGITGLAISFVLALLFQIFLLLPIMLKDKVYSFKIKIGKQRLFELAHILLPLIFLNIICKSNVLVERFLASNMPKGSISYLGYTAKLMSFPLLILSTGIPMVIFPKMALDYAAGDIASLRRTLSKGIEIMWFFVAPVIVLGIVFAFPIVKITLTRGNFLIRDAIVVSDLFRIYLFSLAGACLGGITGRAFYALKDTKVLLLFGAMEAVAYIIYTVFLAKTLGINGIALGFTIYFSLSLCWHLVVLWFKLGAKGGKALFKNILYFGLAAVIAGACSRASAFLFTGSIMQLATGTIVGVTVYLLFLQMFAPDSIGSILKKIFNLKLLFNFKNA